MVKISAGVVSCSVSITRLLTPIVSIKLIRLMYRLLDPSVKDPGGITAVVYSIVVKCPQWWSTVIDACNGVDCC